MRFRWWPTNTWRTTSGGAFLTSDTSNVVATNVCAELPWQHLLAGGTINPDVEQLVGAFGTSTHGYHSELVCLMNGTHDNANYYGGDGLLRTMIACATSVARSPHTGSSNAPGQSEAGPIPSKIGRTNTGPSSTNGFVSKCHPSFPKPTTCAIRARAIPFIKRVYCS